MEEENGNSGEEHCSTRSLEEDAEEYPCPSMGGTGTNSSAAHHHWAVHATNCVLRTTFKSGKYVGERVVNIKLTLTLQNVCITIRIHIPVLIVII